MRKKGYLKKGKTYKCTYCFKIDKELLIYDVAIVETEK